MSRWKRQQRKRALRHRLADRERLFSQISAGITEYVNRRLREPVATPSVYEGYASALLERLVPRPKFECKACMGPSGKLIVVDVTVRNPSPALAAALLEAGGKWV